MKCAKVELKHAEKAKIKLLKLGLFDNSYEVIKDDNYVYFPVKSKVVGFEIVDKKLKKKESKLTLEEALKNKLTKEEFSSLIKSYDTIGGIAVLEIRGDLLKKKVIAEAILKTNKNIKTIVRKVGGHEGKHRVQKYEFLAGEKRFETFYKENGVTVKLDIRKVYFSPRMSSERLRIAKLVNEGEDVLVMFSGVSPYELTIVKNSKVREVYGVEVNPDACKYAEENIKLNKFNKIKLFCGDVKKVVPKLNKKFDRIIMPLPGTARNFLDTALGVLKNGGIVHFYCFSKEDEISEITDFLKEKTKCKVLNIVKCGQQGPRIYRFCIDFKV